MLSEDHVQIYQRFKQQQQQNTAPQKTIYTTG